MISNTPKHLLLRCPSCGSGNILNLFAASDLPSATILHCSRCKAPLGAWEAILQGKAAEAAARDDPARPQKG